MCSLSQKLSTLKSHSHAIKLREKKSFRDFPKIIKGFNLYKLVNIAELAGLVKIDKFHNRKKKNRVQNYF